MKFYLGTHCTNWLWDARFREIPLFVTHRRLRRRVTQYPPAVTRYCVDSGAYTELTSYGRWVETPEQYVAGLRRYWDELGPFDFAGQQDYVCLPDALAKIEHVTGVRPDVQDQLTGTVANFVLLRDLAPDLPIVPTVQGASYEDYLRCADLFAEAGVDLAAEPVVGVGSLVGRAPWEIERIATGLQGRGITRLHGFGVKGLGARAAGHQLASVDSSTWSYEGRKRPLPDCPHEQCQNCARYALRWWHEQLGSFDGPQQLAFAI